MRELLKAMAGQDAELEAAMYAPVGDLAILLRLQSNVKLRLLQMGRIEGAARIVDSMLMLMPRHAGLWRESALLLVRQGKLAAATQALETAIEHETGSERRHESAALLQDLRRRIN
jgi:regulator of sirC expression with transglutaminase-like and TPR domain